MSHLQYVRYCRKLELDPDLYDGIPYPHPYITIWLECKRHANPITGVSSLPEPEKGYLDQDADVMLAFEVLDEIQQRRAEEEERRKQLKAQAATYFGGQSLND